MSIKLLDILKKQITEQGGKFKDMVDLQGKTAGDYYAGAVIGSDMKVSDILSKSELENYGGEVSFEGSPQEVDQSLYTNIDFRDGVVGNSQPSKDKINPSLLKDVDKAAGIAGTKGSVTTAVSGHGPGSRHERGVAVDLSMFDGLGYSTEKVAIDRGIRDKIEKFVRALESMGYLINPKGGEAGTGADKVVLYFGFPNHEHHVHVSRLSYDKESGTPKKETNTKKEEESSVGVKTVVFGGIGYANPTWMKSQWVAAGIPTNNVIFLPHDSSDLSKIKKNNKITKIVGFSAGGTDVWDEIISNSGQYSFMGLIDPSTSVAAFDMYEKGGLPSNVKSLSNYKNWDDYPKIKKILKDLEKNNVLTHTDLSHEKIPLEFFKKYKSDLM